MKKSTITKASAQTRVANLIVTKIQNALQIFSDPAEVEISELESSSMYKVIHVKQNHNIRILTFSEIDTVREVVDKFAKKYHGIGYVMISRTYLAQDGETWLNQPVMEITVRKYDEDIFNK